jgi:hypothetical protein
MAGGASASPHWRTDFEAGWATTDPEALINNGEEGDKERAPWIATNG